MVSFYGIIRNSEPSFLFTFISFSLSFCTYGVLLLIELVKTFQRQISAQARFWRKDVASVIEICVAVHAADCCCD